MELGIPRYLWVYDSLKNQIETEDYKVGDFLPPEPELQKTFHVSRTTVRKAVEMLAQQGFVYIRQGKGTQVLDFKATQKLGNVTSFSETLREKGLHIEQNYGESSLKSQLRKADRIGAEFAIIIGDNELKDRKIQWKNLGNGEQGTVEISNIASVLTNTI